MRSSAVTALSVRAHNVLALEQAVRHSSAHYSPPLPPYPASEKAKRLYPASEKASPFSWARKHSH
ncbi:unnamed protein product [Ectocarpus sp. CCAP 1310/34]|nr:unnamed protein product [Ectocarpus sp. CCAP 1310/34]